MSYPVEFRHHARDSQQGKSDRAQLLFSSRNCAASSNQDATPPPSTELSNYFKIVNPPRKNNDAQTRRNRASTIFAREYLLIVNLLQYVPRSVRPTPTQPDSKSSHCRHPPWAWSRVNAVHHSAQRYLHNGHRSRSSPCPFLIVQVRHRTVPVQLWFCWYIACKRGGRAPYLQM